MMTPSDPCSFTPPTSFHKVLAGGEVPHDGGADLSDDAVAACIELVPTTPNEHIVVTRAPAAEAAVVVSRAGEGGPAHLVLFFGLVAKHSLAFWAAKYLAEEVYGIQAANTLDAKSRDLAAFVRWFVGMNGTGDIGQ